MILTLLLNLFYFLLGGILALLPVGHIPTIMSTSFAYFLGVANLFSYVIPVDTLLQAALVMVAFDGAILLWHFINWVIRKIPGMQ